MPSPSGNWRLLHRELVTEIAAIANPSYFHPTDGTPESTSAIQVQQPCNWWKSLHESEGRMTHGVCGQWPVRALLDLAMGSTRATGQTA